MSGRKSKLVWSAAVALMSMNMATFAANCNCCCKQLNVYGYDQLGGAGTKCWGFDRTIVLEGLVVDSGNCLQNGIPTGRNTLRWEFYGCDLLCVGRNPDGFADPNPLQEAEGDIPDSAVTSGVWEEDNCVTPEGSEPPPGNGCG